MVVWEVRIKQALGKLEVPDDFAAVLAVESFVELPVSIAHAHAIADLEPWHRGPFDRLLLAQARVEELVVVTRDPAFARYGVPVVSA